jgi:hypothetical protein
MLVPGLCGEPQHPRQKGQPLPRTERRPRGPPLRSRALAGALAALPGRRATVLPGTATTSPVRGRKCSRSAQGKGGRHPCGRRLSQSGVVRGVTRRDHESHQPERHLELQQSLSFVQRWLDCRQHLTSPGSQ